MPRCPQRVRRNGLLDHGPSSLNRGCSLGERTEAVDRIAAWPAEIQVLLERLVAGQDVPRVLEGQAQVQERVGYEAARVRLVTTAAGRGDSAHAEPDEVTVSGAGLRLIAGDLQGAGVGPLTPGATGCGRHGARGRAERCGNVSGFKRREREVREETMLRIRLRRHVRSHATESGRGDPPLV